MRIISGKFKNKKLIFPKSFKTRPLKDSVKENIFNILVHSKTIDVEINNSWIVDLYSGSGSFGLECLSRNSSKVYFVERDSEALESLKKNVNNLKIEKKSIIYQEDVLKFLEIFRLKRKIDLIFIDPPYLDTTYLDVIAKIKAKNILKKNHVIILHREAKSIKTEFDHLKILQNKIYGRSEIFFGKLS